MWNGVIEATKDKENKIPPKEGWRGTELEIPPVWRIENGGESLEITCSREVVEKLLAALNLYEIISSLGPSNLVEGAKAKVKVEKERG